MTMTSIAVHGMALPIQYPRSKSVFCVEHTVEPQLSESLGTRGGP